MYALFASGVECGTNDFFISSLVVLSAAWTLASMSERTQGGIVPSTVLTLYCTYLLFSALRRDPSDCNSVAPTAESIDTRQVVIGLMVTAASLTWSAWRLTSSYGQGGVSKHTLPIPSARSVAL